MESATRSLGLLPAPFRNSALAKISQPVAALSAWSLMSGVFPIRPATPSRMGSGVVDAADAVAVAADADLVRSSNWT